MDAARAWQSPRPAPRGFDEHAPQGRMERNEARSRAAPLRPAALDTAPLHGRACSHVGHAGEHGTCAPRESIRAPRITRRISVGAGLGMRAPPRRVLSPFALGLNGAPPSGARAARATRVENKWERRRARGANSLRVLAFSHSVSPHSREAMALPHIRPAPRAGVLARPALEAVTRARRVGLGRRGFAEQAAQVDEVLLAPGALLQLRSPPLGDERGGSHGTGTAGSGSMRRSSARGVLADTAHLTRPERRASRTKAEILTGDAAMPRAGCRGAARRRVL